ncbi:amidohydrolase [Sphingomonas sp. Root710]|uniref:amidohydrolase n=1 Tax=Sphingomonas sp. Root710 TaxID=1736594 RepID=UPI0006FC4760|nr:amidohydrolase [Sphingomonas sp. Root710]KRB80580.1 amidohydrolase [Sphingomonas sp. Root710]
MTLFRIARKTGFSALALAIAGASGASAATGQAAADLILTNARVYTVEKTLPWAQAVAVSNGRIVAVGSAAQVARRKGAGTRVVDLGGKMLMPAFGDAHNHPLFGGLSQARCPIHSGKTVEDYKKLIAACVEKAPAGGGIVYGLGWTETVFPDGSPRKETLDEISRDRPIAIGSGDGHSMWANSKMLELAGITRDTPDPAGGRIIRDPKTGEPTGHLAEESAMALVEKLVPPPTATEIQGAIVWVLKHFNGIGITNWHDAGVDIDDDGRSAVIEAYRVVKDKGVLTSHVAIDQKWKNDRGLEQIPSILRGAERAKSYGLNAYSVKYYLDGVIPQHTAAMLAPYEGTSERGKATIAPAMLSDAISALDAKGVQAHIHAIGDAAVREGLDAFAAARQRNGMSDTRPMMSHMNVIDPADQPRFGQLRAYAVFQPLWASNEAYMDLSKAAIGPKRSGYIYPAGSVVRGGGKLAYGADWPVASANPLEGIEVALTRSNHAHPELGPLLPGEAVTLPEAIASYTIHVAEVNHNDKQTGSIAPGKSADLIVIDRNLFDIPANQISQAKVLLTLFAGRAVFGDLEAVNGNK